MSKSLYSGFEKNAFNQTKVELKCGIDILKQSLSYSFNQTKVELKCVWVPASQHLTVF